MSMHLLWNMFFLLENIRIYLVWAFTILPRRHFSAFFLVRNFSSDPFNQFSSLYNWLISLTVNRTNTHLHKWFNSFVCVYVETWKKWNCQHDMDTQNDIRIPKYIMYWFGYSSNAFRNFDSDNWENHIIQKMDYFARTAIRSCDLNMFRCKSIRWYFQKSNIQSGRINQHWWKKATSRSGVNNFVWTYLRCVDQSTLSDIRFTILVRI